MCFDLCIPIALRFLSLNIGEINSSWTFCLFLISMSCALWADPITKKFFFKQKELDRILLLWADKYTPSRPSLIANLTLFAKISLILFFLQKIAVFTSSLILIWSDFALQIKFIFLLNFFSLVWLKSSIKWYFFRDCICMNQ